MSRRTNLNTLRNRFNWESNWATYNQYYTQVVWFDIKITDFLNGLFYVLRMPTSSYTIRRFLNSFVIVETDIWLLSMKHLKYSFHNISYFSYLVYKLRKLFGIVQCNNSFKIKSASDIVFYFLNKYNSRSRVKKKKKVKIKQKLIGTIPKFKYDANSLRRSDEEIYNIDSLDYLNLYKKWMPMHPKAQFWSTKTVNLLSKLYNTLNLTWNKVDPLSKPEDVHRYLHFCRSYSEPYFFNSCKLKIKSYAKWAKKRFVRKRRTRITNYLIKLCYFKIKSSRWILRLLNDVKLSYNLRNLWHIGFSLRLICYYTYMWSISKLFLKLNNKVSNSTHFIVNHVI